MTKENTLQHIAETKGPMALQAALVGFAHRLPAPITDEQGRTLYMIPDWKTFMAKLSQDSQFMKAIRVSESDIPKGETILKVYGPGPFTDLHRLTAGALYGIALDHITPASRASAKVHNYRFLYGMTSTFGGDYTEAEKEQGFKSELAEMVAELLGIPKECVRYMGGVHDDHVFEVRKEPNLLKDRKLSVVAGVGGGAGGAVNGANTVAHRPAKPMTEERMVLHRAVQKMDKIKRALHNITREVEDLDGYLRDKLEEYKRNV